MKKLIHSLAFVLLALALFLGALRGAASVKWGDYSALQLLTHTYEAPGGRFWSLERFRDARSRGHVDVVVLGSSHAYRGFDPRVFEARGLSLANLGSTSQSPLNSRYLAEQFVPVMTPKLVVVEVYHGTLMGDGLESVRDLSVNTPASASMMKMAWATWDVRAIGYATAKLVGFLPSEDAATQAPQPGERYVAGGYVETTRGRESLQVGPPLTIEIRNAQLEELIALTRFSLARGAKVVWVTHPLPSDHLERLTDRRAIQARISDAAAKAGVPYWNFGDDLTLDPLEDFADFHHLNASGVAKFDSAFLQRAEDEGLLESAAMP